MRKALLLVALLAAPLLAASAAPASAQARSVFVDDLTWPEVRDAIAAGKSTAIIFVGSSEQNGPHMAIGKHNFIARYCAERIAGELGDALVYPVIPFAITGDAAQTDPACALSDDHESLVLTALEDASTGGDDFVYRNFRTAKVLPEF